MYEINNVSKTYYNFNGDITLNKTSNKYSNDTYSMVKTNNAFNTTDNRYSTKEINNTSSITNNITRHSHNNYENNVLKRVSKHKKHLNNYDTEIYYYKKKPHNKKNYCNLYTDNLNFRKIENISLSQQTDITNNIIETNTQTSTYVGNNNSLNKNKIATVIVNPNPSLTENYLWIPETTDNLAPGLDSLAICLNQKFASISTLQNSITNINATINNEMQNLQAEIDNIEVINPTTGDVSKNLPYHTSHTDFTYQRNIANNGNRRQFVIQNHYFTYQRKSNHELQFQALNTIVADLQNQIDNLSSGGGGSGGGGEMGVSWTNKNIIIFYFLYIYTHTNMWNEYLYIVINPVPSCIFQNTPRHKHKNSI